MTTRPLGGHYLSTAFTLVRAADAAYRKDPTTATDFEMFGFDSVQSFGCNGSLSVDSTRGYVAERSDAIVLAFRGTKIENIEDWIVNLNFQQVVDNGALVHKGFLEALSDVWDSVDEMLRKLIEKKLRKIWITGHSLGGALATLASRWISAQRLGPVETYTFGQPRVGNAEMVRQIKTPFYRFAYFSDPVPLAPFSLPVKLDYRHAGTSIILYADGSALEAESNPLAQMLLTAMSTTLFAENFFRKGIERFIDERIGDHLSANYVNKIELAVERQQKRLDSKTF